MSVSAGVPTGNTDSVVDCETATELACRDNELGYMYYYYLPAGKTGTQTVDDVTLTNIPADSWSGTEFDADDAWIFSFFNGNNIVGAKSSRFVGWAVRDGDIGAPSDPVDLTGTVQDAGGTPLCALVLASGQFKLQVYADGFVPSIQVFDEFQTVNDVRMTRAVECLR